MFLEKKCYQCSLNWFDFNQLNEIIFTNSFQTTERNFAIDSGTGVWLSNNQEQYNYKEALKTILCLERKMTGMWLSNKQGQ